MNLFYMFMSIVLISIIVPHYNEIAPYIAVPLLIIAFVPAFIAVIRSEIREMNTDAKLKEIERMNKNDKS